MNLNKVIICGNLTRDPEVKALPSGVTVANLGVATNRFYTKDGERQQLVEYHNIVLFGNMADNVEKYMKKGNMIMIEGRLQTRSWEDSDGKKNYRTEIIGENMQFGPKSGGGSAPSEENAPQADYPKNDINPDDIPF